MGAIAIFLPRQGPPGLSVVGRMVAAAPHRGILVETVIHGRCALACSTDAGAPDAVMDTKDGIAVAFVGTLDNAAELAREFFPGGHDPVPGGGIASVPPLLAAGFRALGADLAARLRGVFACAISDGEHVVCFRDQVGYRPLFYRRDSRGFYAATEAKQVVAGANIPREPDLDVVQQIYFRTYDDATPSALSGVRRLPKATTLLADAEGVQLRRYWHPAMLLETARYAPDELRDRFVALLDQSVARCLTGNDAISLSGGIDSPAIAAFAAPRHLTLGNQPLTAISVVYPQHPSVDESRYVQLLAERFGLPLHAYEQKANPLSDLARWVALADTPWAGAALAQYEEDYLRARALGCRTVLTGEHAEYVFALQWYTLEHYLTHGRLRAARRDLAERRSRGSSWAGLVRLVVRSLASDRLMSARHALGGAPRYVPTWVDSRRLSAESVPVRERWRRAQLAGFIGPGISLEAEEVCQEITGVRSRKPWTDVDLWEFFLSLRAEQKFPNLRPKGLVRDLLRGRVPDIILDRQDKTVFDEAAMAQVDYPALRGWLIGARHQLAGVDYAGLQRLLETERLTALDYQWARNLANVQAFLSQW